MCLITLGEIMKMKQTTMDIKRAANLLKLLGHETRLTILKILTVRECCVCEFVEIFTASQPAISQHLRKLRDAELIAEERKGQWNYYSLNKQSKYYSFLKIILTGVTTPKNQLAQLLSNGGQRKC